MAIAANVTNSAVDTILERLSAWTRHHPLANPARHGIHVTRDLQYHNSDLPEHRLDIYRPEAGSGLKPIVLYLHGGSFRILSKDSHWMMALMFARAGYVVANANYRLAPKNPYPAAVEDASKAYAWVVRNATAFGGDPSRIVIAGESAGANLALGLALSCCYERPEATARAVYELGVVPRAVIAYCGLLQTTEVERFFANKRGALVSLAKQRLLAIQRDYLGSTPPEHHGLADPLCELEQASSPTRALPNIFVAAGTKDPIMDDSIRLEHRLLTMSAKVQAKYYAGQGHAFMAMLWKSKARQCWRDTMAFLRQEFGDRAFQAP